MEGCSAFVLAFRKNPVQKRMTPALPHKQPVGTPSGAGFALSGAAVSSSCAALTVSVPATAVLVVASTEVDKSGASYYGEQTLHYVAASGESAVVQLREYPMLPCSPGTGPYSKALHTKNPSPCSALAFYLCRKVLLFSGLVWGFLQ